ncbi:MAG: hypothetical protein KKH98_10190, partial [Spirochaetes bacterium]|nr:hypothetical protein [Spirochaetota bacterium]
ENLSAWVKFKSEYVQFHWKKDDRFLFINSMALEYQVSPVAKILLGSIYVDYSPYVAMSFPWVHDLFRGFGFEHNSYKLKVHAFIANNGDNPDESGWSPPVSFDLDYRFIDKGYNASGQNSEYPTLWAGSKIRYTFTRNAVFTPDIALIYLRENYTKRDYPEGYVDINDNNIFGAEFNFNLLDYINFKNVGAITLNKTDKYTAYSNFFGEGKARLDFEKGEYYKYHGGNIRCEIDDLFAGLLHQFNTRAFYEYEKVDPLYHPTYMNQNLDNRSINPYESVISGREGYWAGGEQNIGFGFFAGGGYQYYVYKKSYYHKFPDSAIFTEKQITLKNELLGEFRIFFVYQIREMLRKTLPEGQKKMNSFYLNIKSDIVHNVALELEYVKNKDFYEKYDEIAIKFLVWGW